MPPKLADECEHAKSFFDSGNVARQANDHLAALQAYTSGIETARSVELRSALHVNRGVTLAALGRYEEALSDSEACAKVRPSWSRTYECYATALEGLGRHQEAEATSRLADALKTLKQDSKNDENKKRVKALRQEIRRIQSQETPGGNEAQQAPSNGGSTPQIALTATPEVVLAQPQSQSQPLADQQAKAQKEQLATTNPPIPVEDSPAPGLFQSPAQQSKTEKTSRFKAPLPPSPAIFVEEQTAPDERDKAVDLLLQGNESQAQHNYEEALSKYAKALESTDEPELCKAIFFNCSLANARLQRFERADQHADQCIHIDPLWADGFECKGTALEVSPLGN